MATASIETFLTEAWRRKGACFYLLLMPLSWLFGGVVTLRRLAYQRGILKSRKLPVPVVVVGNISVGGTGKTPVVIWLVEQLKQYGYRPGVISRGYGVKAQSPVMVSAASEAKNVGDEPLLIALRCGCPVTICTNRVLAAEALLAAHPDRNILISDDGLQHYALQRDVEIAVVDAQTSHHARLLPAGRLREPIERLKSVDWVISNGPMRLGSAHAMKLIGSQFYNLGNPALLAQPTDFAGKAIRAMAGIGQPERFFEHLRQLGLTFSSMVFEDHHAYSAADLANIECDILLMTEKDAVKCKHFAQAHHWVLPIEAEINEALLPTLLEKIARK
jgi:tetraacyldisaccharide 4'-kinase